MSTKAKCIDGSAKMNLYMTVHGSCARAMNSFKLFVLLCWMFTCLKGFMDPSFLQVLFEINALVHKKEYSV
ncbi:MAG: hypothetical protein DWQ10_06670 [Calditrichaeota bacterium]|nr:MAG: hypothetical protein DWQ10_06670 [Calditrichota bacterium]